MGGGEGRMESGSLGLDLICGVVDWDIQVLFQNLRLMDLDLH